MNFVYCSDNLIRVAFHKVHAYTLSGQLHCLTELARLYVHAYTLSIATEVTQASPT